MSGLGAEPDTVARAPYEVESDRQYDETPVATMRNTLQSMQMVHRTVYTSAKVQTSRPTDLAAIVDAVLE
jgi:hypothetical protein